MSDPVYDVLLDIQLRIGFATGVIVPYWLIVTVGVVLVVAAISGLILPFLPSRRNDP